MVRPRRFCDEEEVEIIRRYQAGASVEALSRALSCSATAVRGVLTRRGIPIRAAVRTSRFTAQQEEEIVRQYDAGESIYRLARCWGVAADTVRNVLRRRAVPRRPAFVCENCGSTHVQTLRPGERAETAAPHR